MRDLCKACHTSIAMNCDIQFRITHLKDLPGFATSVHVRSSGKALCQPVRKPGFRPWNPVAPVKSLAHNKKTNLSNWAGPRRSWPTRLGRLTDEGCEPRVLEGSWRHPVATVNIIMFTDNGIAIVDFGDFGEARPYDVKPKVEIWRGGGWGNMRNSGELLGRSVI